MNEDPIDYCVPHKFEMESYSICSVEIICYRCGWAHMTNSCSRYKSHQVDKEHNAAVDVSKQYVTEVSTPINIAPSVSHSPALTIGQGSMLDIPSTLGAIEHVNDNLSHQGVGPVRPLPQGKLAIALPGETIKREDGQNNERLHLLRPRAQPLVKVTSPRKNWSELQHRSVDMVEHLYSDSSESNCEKLSSSNSKVVEDDEIDGIFHYQSKSLPINMVSTNGPRTFKTEDSEEEF